MLRIVTVSQAALFSVVLVLCTIGAFALSNTMSSVYVLLVFGVLGYAMVKSGFPLALFIIGGVLGEHIEINLSEAAMADANPWDFVNHPISGGLLAAAVASVVVPVRQHRRHTSRARVGRSD